MSSQNESEYGAGLTLGQLLSFITKTWKAMAAGGIVAGLVAGIVLLILPRDYEAAATLVVVPPTFTSELKQTTLTVQGYQRLLESDEVLSLSKRRLEAEGSLEVDETLELGEDIMTRIFVSRKSEETELAPIVQAVAVWDDPETAAAIANSWAEIFVVKTQELMSGSTSVTVEFIEAEYGTRRLELQGLENDLVDVGDRYQVLHDSAEDRWERKTADLIAETEGLKAAHASETKRLIDAFRTERNLDTRRAELEAVRTAFGDLNDEQARVTSELQRMELRLAAASSQLESTPKVIELRKAVSDDVLWETVMAPDENGEKQRSSAQAELEDFGLLTQEINPVFIELAQRGSELELEVNALKPRREQLKKELESISAELKAFDSAIAVDDGELEKLREHRRAEFNSLIEQRRAELAIMRRAAQRELDEIDREGTIRVRQSQRDVDHGRGLYGQLASNYNQALLARGQLDVEDVRIGSKAVAPQEPLPRYGALKLLLAAILGSLAVGAQRLIRELADAGL